jgi:hypothetical protein
MIMRMFVASAVLMMAAVPASAATVLFSQNFDSLPVGTPAASVPGFSVTGTVDVVADNSFGIRCVGNAGKCLDLDGTPGPGSMTTTSINYAAGRQLKLSFDMSGNQRDQNSDLFEWTFVLAAPSDIQNFLCTSGFGGCPAPGNYFNVTTPGFYGEAVAGNRGWLNYAMQFTPTTAGSLTMTFRTSSADNIGPLIDNVLVTQAAIPEPASWAMLIAGFGLVGAVSRRRRLAIA